MMHRLQQQKMAPRRTTPRFKSYQKLRQIILMIFMLHSMQAMAADGKATLLQAWERIQNNSSETVEFRKLAEKKYWIKFSTLPYEGELMVLAYDVEDMDFGPITPPYTKMGYVEVDLIDTTQDKLNKYQRSYNKWIQTNTLYLNSATGDWDSWETYKSHLEQTAEEEDTSSWLYPLLDYWDLLVVAILIYFLVTVFINNKRVSESFVMQKRAIDDMESTKRYMKESMILHNKTNQLLEDILDLLKKD